MQRGACIAAVLFSACPVLAAIDAAGDIITAEDLLAPKPAWVERARFPEPRGGDAVHGGTELLLDDQQIYLDGGSP